jgi:hypothetical protein
MKLLTPCLSVLYFVQFLENNISIRTDDCAYAEQVDFVG